MDMFVSDKTITRENAQKRGLFYIEDVLLNDTLWKSWSKITYYAYFNGYVFGNPVTKEKSKEGLWFGLYIPDPSLTFIFDETLSGKNADARNMYHLFDIYNPVEKVKEMDRLSLYVLTHGGILGKPVREESNDKDWYGIYIAKVLDNVLVPQIPIDKSLNPKSAQQRGYIHENNFFYDRTVGLHNLIQVLRDFWDNNIDFVDTTGSLFGMPSQECNPQESYIGVYTRV